uniref:Protein SDA1 n=1 Tax=Steinernema glaseri TaxID=37863 RepID=A0A1I7Z8I0_9BILA
MYGKAGPSRPQLRRRGRRVRQTTIEHEPLLPYAELLEDLAEIDFPSIESNVDEESRTAFFVALNKVASQLKGRHELELASEELFTVVFHKCFYLLNNPQSCVRTIVLRIFRLLLVRDRVLQQYLHHRFDIVVLR